MAKGYDVTGTEKEVTVRAMYTTLDTGPMYFNEALDEIWFKHLKPLMIQRHLKYGPGNIKQFGDKGVVVRASDKVQRLINFYFKDGEAYDDESVYDTWMDLANYGVIALMWLYGFWELPVDEA